jgi:hypothetical protein
MTPSGARRRLVLASNNAGKLAELQALLAPLGVELVRQADLGVGEAPEPHRTFIENALSKARYAAAHTGLPALADDAGLCVDAFGGLPGVDTAYYATQFGYPKGDDHFWTQGEPERHRHWFPGYDYPNERFTSEVICRVPQGMTVLSNGRLVEESAAGDKTLFHWKQEQEHVNYLISVVGGYFQKLEGKHGDLPLAFLTPPSEFAVAEKSFRDTDAILAFFDAEIGVKYTRPK